MIDLMDERHSWSQDMSAGSRVEAHTWATYFYVLVHDHRDGSTVSLEFDGQAAALEFADRLRAAILDPIE